MKATGIVRRIDDLGRVVIPKEIRRTMRIREGDPLEIFTDKDGEVIFKKYSPIGELAQYVNVFAETVNKSTGSTAVVVDKDTVIAVSGPYKKELMEHKISHDIETMLESRQQYVYKIGDKRIPVAENTEKCHAGVVNPVIVDGDVIGALILLIPEQGNAPTDIDIKIMSTSAQLLARQLEA